MFGKLCIFFCCFSFSLAAEKQSICLNMIVKNESKVIKRCLDSVKPIIDYWVIVDTGSTDGTQEIIQEYMKDIPGVLYERPWENFAYNRNEALVLAKNRGDYILFIDADEEFIYEQDFKMPKLNMDSYLVAIDLFGVRYYRRLFINNQCEWKWVGVLHEHLEYEGQSVEPLEGITNVSHGEGCRSQDPKVFENDVKILEEALKKEPNNSRYVFYLATSYKLIGKYDLAVKNYQKRIGMGEDGEEVFWSLYQTAYLQELLQKPSDVVIKGYCDAFHYRPTRAEPLCRLAMYCRNQKNYLLSYAIANLGTSIEKPKDMLMVEEWVYDYWLRMEKAIGAYWVGKYEEANSEAVKLLIDPKFPKEMHVYADDVVKWAHPHLSQK